MWDEIEMKKQTKTTFQNISKLWKIFQKFLKKKVAPKIGKL
jgi:hypothetical protein